MTLSIRYRATIEAMTANNDNILNIINQECSSQDDARTVIDNVFKDTATMHKITRQFNPAYYRATISVVSDDDTFCQSAEEFL